MNNYKPFKLTEKCVNDMSETEWLEAREHGPNGDIEYAIGGSTVPVVLGVNNYQTPQELFDAKKGHPLKRNMNQDILDRGHLFEEPVARCLEHDLKEEYGKENVIVGFDKFMYGCGEKNNAGELKYPYMIINYDCWVKIRIDGKWHMYLGEIKTTGSNNYEVHKQWKSKIVPIDYEYQCRYYMKGLNVDGCFIMCAWGLDKADRAYIFIKRDEVIEQDMMDTCDEFIQCLKTNTPPDITNVKTNLMNQYYARLYGDVKSIADEPEFEIPSDYKDALDLITKADTQLVTLDAKKEAIKDMREKGIMSLYPLFKKASRGRYVLSETKTLYITSKVSHDRDILDKEALQIADPALYNRYLEPVFNDAAFKKKEDAAVIQKYTIVGKSKDERTWDARLYDRELGVTTRRITSKTNNMSFKTEKGLKL